MHRARKIQTASAADCVCLTRANMNFLFGYDEHKLKSHLEMAVQRIKIHNNKSSTKLKHDKREIAKLLEENKDEKARIKVEHVIREDFVIEAYEIVELLCELVHERSKYLSSTKECPDDLIEAVSSLIWAADRCNIDEMSEIKNQLSKKLGKPFTTNAQANANDCVNRRLFQKLIVIPPSAHLVIRYLEEIAKEYQVEWSSSSMGLPEDLSAPIASPLGGSIPMAPGSNLRSAYASEVPAQIARPVIEEPAPVTAPMPASEQPSVPLYPAKIERAPSSAPEPMTENSALCEASVDDIKAAATAPVVDPPAGPAVATDAPQVVPVDEFAALQARFAALSGHEAGGKKEYEL